MEELRCPYCQSALSEDMIDAKMCFECGESFEDVPLTKDALEELAEKVALDRIQKDENISFLEKIRQNKEKELLEIQKTIDERNKKIQQIVVTTGDLKEDYEIISPVFFQLSNKGIFSSTYSKLVQQYSYKFKSMEQEGVVSGAKKDWGFLYGEWSVGQNDFEKAFYIAIEELKKRATILGADAIICMRQDIDLDTNGFAFFYLQMYGTAVRYTHKHGTE